MSADVSGRFDNRAPQRLVDYLAARQAWGHEFPTGGIPAPRSSRDDARGLWNRLRNMVPRDLRFALRYAAQHHVTSAMRTVERRRARRMQDRSHVRLHLGCGPYRKDGWINIDLAGHPVDIRWNLERPLPFPDGTVDGIFHEHLLEHLPPAAGLDFLRANYRLLRPGGVLRVVVPDAGRYLLSYNNGGEGLIHAVRPDRPTNMMAVNELFYLYTHATMYDEETLGLFLRAAGFSVVDVMAMGHSRFEPCPDSPHRQPESLYMEAVK